MAQSIRILCKKRINIKNGNAYRVYEPQKRRWGFLWWVPLCKREFETLKAAKLFVNNYVSFGYRKEQLWVEEEYKE